MSRASLPDPSTEERQRSLRLSALIAAEISEQGGWIGFDQFMQMALYQPELGYYTGPSAKFGEEGDFVTAPLIGALFAGCVAAQCGQIITELRQTTEIISIYEFGAGSGNLARDLLSALEDIGSLPDQYVIIETSGQLQQQQRDTLDQLPSSLRQKIHWKSSLPDVISGIVLANELLDAMPCKRLVLDQDGLAVELGVANDDNGFRWAAGEQLVGGSARFDIAITDPGYQTEIGMQAEAWIRTVGGLLESGAMLLIDYGFAAGEFYHPDRRGGTLMCHYRHFAHDDPFFRPGLQDITAHVDFSAIARAARQTDLQVSGYCNQANFLLSCGLIDILAACQNDVVADDNQTRHMLELTGEVKKLTMPHEMGELFKVIALTKNYHQPLKGFTLRNNAYQLVDD